jgi:acyl-coenzyme A synthetase/AMP-(fatty) acid ligase
VQDAYAGEVPKAYVVKAKEAERRPETDVIRDIVRHVEEHKAKHKWLKGGIKFVDIIPKSPSGKILRRLLRDQERESTRKNGVKL